MGILSNPLYLLGPPLLVVVSLPLAIFAAITTAIALALLTLRVSVVYFELGIALVRGYIFPEPAKPLPRRAAPPPLTPPRLRHSSLTSHLAKPTARLQRKSGSSASLVSANPLASTRDYEGIGGWRFYEGEEEEAIWMGMNKRLELPLALPPGRRHQRRHTGEDQRSSGSPEALRMSPWQSRGRTPPRTAIPQNTEGDDYFPPQPVLRPLTTAMELLSLTIQHSRRASVVSISGSSSSATGSSPNK